MWRRREQGCNARVSVRLLLLLLMNDAVAVGCWVMVAASDVAQEAAGRTVPYLVAHLGSEIEFRALAKMHIIYI